MLSEPLVISKMLITWAILFPSRFLLIWDRDCCTISLSPPTLPARRLLIFLVLVWHLHSVSSICFITSQFYAYGLVLISSFHFIPPQPLPYTSYIKTQSPQKIPVLHPAFNHTPSSKKMYVVVLERSTVIFIYYLTITLTLTFFYYTQKCIV